MTKQVVLLLNSHDAPTLALTEVLQEAGVAVLLHGLPAAGVDHSGGNGNASDECLEKADTLPLAVLYEVKAGADVVEIHAAVEHALAAWPGVALVALRRQINGHGNGHGLGQHLPMLDGAALKRLGFRAIADRLAQLPALLRALEENGTTGELQLPEDIESQPEVIAPPLPAGLNSNSLRAAFELVAALHSIHDQRGTAQAALAGLESLVRADRWAIYLTSETNGGEMPRLEPLAVRGQNSVERAVQEKDWHSILTGNVTLSGAESKAARKAAASMEIIRKTETGRRILALPLVSGERVMGVLEAVREGHRARAFTRRETALLCTLAVYISYALTNSVRIADAERLSLTDDLTKLHNARYLRQFLLTELRRARRYGSNVSALFFDIDDFKSINDVHGHLVGSHVLMEMAAVILSSVRDTDMVARYGGDEFVVVLPETPLEQAIQVAERVREKIAYHEFNGGRRLRLRITASFGVAAFPQHAPSPQQLVSCADAAMYEAKAAGKNRVRIAFVPSLEQAEV